MDLYDVLSEGYHTPLTSAQIADLYQAGRLRPDEACRRAGNGPWRTLDELFPLLKYDVGAYSHALEDATHQHSGATIPLAITLGVLLLGAAAYFLWGRMAEPAAVEASFVRVPHYHQLVSRAAARSTTIVSPPSIPALPAPSYDQPQADRPRANLERLAAEQRQREQIASDQAALADRLRAEAAQRERDAEKAAGRDVIVPLDEYTTITDVGGSAVAIKVHDNDVTSFDVWINGRYLRNIVKQKGITHSRTDETLIYRSGNASLYYVWEISGGVNSCLLRVREE